MNILYTVLLVIFGISLGYTIFLILNIFINFYKKNVNQKNKKEIYEVNEMKTIKDRLNILESEVKIKKKRISDNTIVEIQEVMNKLKTLIDNEVIRRKEKGNVTGKSLYSKENEFKKTN